MTYYLLEFNSRLIPEDLTAFDLVGIYPSETEAEQAKTEFIDSYWDTDICEHADAMRLIDRCLRISIFTNSTKEQR
jgi:hypothetical protein